MSGKWFSCLFIDQLFCISVVSTDKHLSAYFLHCINCFSYAFVNCFDCFDYSGFYTGMTNHIRVSKVDYDHIVLISLDCIYKLVTYFICAHFRFQVVSCNLWRFDKDSVLALVRFFYSAVEEKRNMCIFFCLSDSCLCHVVCCKEFAKCIGNTFFYKCNGLVRDCLIILCKAYISRLDPFSSVKSVKFIRTECSGDLSCTVRAEIEEDHRISVFYSCYRCTVFCYYKWYYEFVSYFFVVRSLDSFCC